jgi:hypothetical protein
VKKNSLAVMTNQSSRSVKCPGHFGAALTFCEKTMASFAFGKRVLMIGSTVLAGALAAHGQGNYAAEGTEYNITGVLPGDQVYPHVSIQTGGGYLVWQDNFTDGSGAGISARKLDSSFSSAFSTFRVNAGGNGDQERPAVSMLNNGGAAFVWRGGKQGFQHIYARFLTADGTWVTPESDVMVNTATNVFQVEQTMATLTNGNVVVSWATFNQVSSNSLRDVYFQILSPTGAKVGGETRANAFTSYNQRSSAIAPLSDGRFVVVWVSEQQRYSPNSGLDYLNGVSSTLIGPASVDVYGRIFNASGTAVTGEFLINTGTNVCANPSVARTSDGGFGVAWMERDTLTRSNSWDVYFRPFTGNALGGTTRRINSNLYGDQLAPKISSMGTDYLVVWTSMGQDGSREGIYGQYLRADGTPLYGEFQVNTTFASQQYQPAIASDGVERFLAVWTSFVGGAGSFDLYAHRFMNTNAPILPMSPPYVTAVSSNALMVSWEPVQGLAVANYEVYADGSAAATALVSNIYWKATGLAPSSTHSYRLAYRLTDGRLSPLSGSTTNVTYAALWYYNAIPQEWMTGYFGSTFWTWPSPDADSDGDGASNFNEFLAGTDPTSAASKLVQKLRPTVQGLFLDWNTIPGLVYQVQVATAPSGPWTNLGGLRFAAGTTDSMYVGGSTTRFFRIARLR